MRRVLVFSVLLVAFLDLWCVSAAGAQETVEPATRPDVILLSDPSATPDGKSPDRPSLDRQGSDGGQPDKSASHGQAAGESPASERKPAAKTLSSARAVSSRPQPPASSAAPPLVVAPVIVPQIQLPAAAVGGTSPIRAPSAPAASVRTPLPN